VISCFLRKFKSFDLIQVYPFSESYFYVFISNSINRVFLNKQC